MRGDIGNDDFVSILSVYNSWSDMMLAELLGVSEPTIKSWRAGKTFPHVALRSTIVRVLEQASSQVRR